VIEDLVRKGAPIDVFGVGTELTTSRDDPAMNGVYKLVAIKVPADGEKVLYKLKTSPGKKTYPGPKQVYRTLESGTIKSDTVALEDEEPPQGATPLLEKYVEGGRLERSLPSLKDIQSFHRQQVKTLPSEFTDISAPVESFPVRFSEKIEEAARRFQHK
ncbi:MAG: nicotinate phosphoribosyltransferase, partial [Nitrososphaera sp.]